MKRSEMLSPTISELSAVTELNYAKGMALPRNEFEFGHNTPQLNKTRCCQP